MNQTIDYYNKNAKTYFEQTVTLDMDEIRETFMDQVLPGGRILDAGCGSGRDAKYFLDNGFSVEAFDASKQMVRLARAYTGLPVQCVRFQDLDIEQRFDGIWACASLLHVPKEQMNDVIARLYRALKDNGILYASFKIGQTERIEGQRFFNDYEKQDMHILFAAFKILDVFESHGNQQNWINVLVQKKQSEDCQ